MTWAVLPLLLAVLPASAEGAEPAAAAQPAPKPSVIVLDLQPTNADAQTAQLITDLVAVSLGRTKHFQVLTSEDVRSVVALEAEKHALGCDDASCLAEIAGAMGADYVLHGSVGALGALFVVNLNLFDSQQAKSIGRESAQVTDRAKLPAAIDEMTKILIVELVPEAPVAVSEPAAPSAPEAAVAPDEPALASADAASPPFLSPLFLGGAVGAALCAAGTVGLGLYAVTQNDIVSDPAELGEARKEARSTGQLALAGAGTLAVATVLAAGVAAVPFVLE